jgi:hypothetical protein
MLKTLSRRGPSRSFHGSYSVANGSTLPTPRSLSVLKVAPQLFGVITSRSLYATNSTLNGRLLREFVLNDTGLARKRTEERFKLDQT